MTGDDKRERPAVNVRGGKNHRNDPRSNQNFLRPGFAVELHGRERIDDSVVSRTENK